MRTYFWGVGGGVGIELTLATGVVGVVMVAGGDSLTGDWGGGGIVETGGAGGLLSRVSGLAVPFTTSDILFSKTSPADVLFCDKERKTH